MFIVNGNDYMEFFFIFVLFHSFVFCAQNVFNQNEAIK